MIGSTTPVNYRFIVKAALYELKTGQSLTTTSAEDYGTGEEIRFMGVLPYGESFAATSVQFLSALGQATGTEVARRIKITTESQ